jgi:predicted O-methyltransferase YrrM
VNEIIRRIFETNSVIGQSGKFHNLHSAIDHAEGEFLVRIIRDDPSIVNTLEVGCAYGISSLFICSALQGRNGVSHTIIDPFQNSTWDGAGIRSLEEAGYSFFKLIEIKSEFALPKLLEKLEGQFDFIFIDGWHTFDHTLLDCFYATRLLRVGGYLAIDDVTLSSIRRVVDFLSNYPCYEFYGSVSSKRTRSTRSWKNFLIRSLMSPVHRRIWARVLSRSLYRRIIEDQFPRMVALKKVTEDNRNWDWHNDAF